MKKLCSNQAFVLGFVFVLIANLSVASEPKEREPRKGPPHREQGEGAHKERRESSGQERGGRGRHGLSSEGRSQIRVLVNTYKEDRAKLKSEFKASLDVLKEKRKSEEITRKEFKEQRKTLAQAYKENVASIRKVLSDQIKVIFERENQGPVVCGGDAAPAPGCLPPEPVEPDLQPEAEASDGGEH